MTSEGMRLLQSQEHSTAAVRSSVLRYLKGKASNVTLV